MLRFKLLYGLVFIFCVTVLQSRAQEISYTGSLQYARGEYYFSEATRSVYFTNGLMVKQGRLNLSMSIPFVIQNTPWISYSRFGQLPTGGPQHESVGRRETGGDGMGVRQSNHRIDLPDTSSYQSSTFSDPSLFGSVRVAGPGGSTNLYLQGSVKFPLADPDDGYGTGAWDGGLGGSIAHRLDQWIIMANVMYWWLGDMPDLELKDIIGYSGGLGRSLSQGKWSVLLSFSGFTEIIDDIDPPISLGSSINYNLNQRVGLSATLSVGLTESASDISLGIGWTVQLN